MRLLVLGGTVFVGRAFVKAALAQGHDITLFHRGTHGVDLFPKVKRVRGDRDGGLDALHGDWDAVVDTCGYLPRVVRQSTQAFRERAKTYLFVSTISVYAEPLEPGADEAAPLIQLSDPTVEDVPTYYGGLKVLCENEVNEAFPGRAFIVRPGLICGPHDPTNRFTYWPHRIDEGGEILAIARPGQPMQLIDVRDLAAFMVKGLEEGYLGAFNTAGPQSTFGEMLRASGATAVRWASPEFLEANGVKTWSDLPLTLSPDGSADGMLQVSSAKAVEAGLQYRGLPETARETLAWRKTVEEYDDRGMGMSRKREAELLKLEKAAGDGT